MSSGVHRPWCAPVGGLHVGTKRDTSPGAGQAPPLHEAAPPPSPCAGAPAAPSRVARVEASAVEVESPPEGPPATIPPQANAAAAATATATQPVRSLDAVPIAAVPIDAMPLVTTRFSVASVGALGVACRITMRATFAPAALIVLAAAAPLVSCGSRSELPGALGDAGAAPVDAAVEAPPPLQPGAPCGTDADCATGRYCVAAYRCDPALGCVLTPRSCDDAVDCTRDACSDVTRSCAHTPDDTLCPSTALCSARRGCDAFVYAMASDMHLYEARVPSGALVDLGMPAPALTDLALGSNGVLYATDSYILYTVDRATADAATIASILPVHQYAGLGASAGVLLATADVSQLFQVDVASGASLPVAALPSSFTGDVTALGDRVLVSVSNVNPPTDTLVAWDRSAQSVTVVGDLRFARVWGLATLGGVVYGLTSTGAILTVDPTTGNATQLSQAVARFVGAAGR
jgi:hypothetical protein